MARLMKTTFSREKKIVQVSDDSIHFFKDIISKALKNKEFAMHLTQSRLKPEHFPKKYFQWLYKEIKMFIDNPKYNSKMPSLRIIKDKIAGDKTIDMSLKNIYYDKLKELFVRNVTHEEYSLEAVEKIIQRQEFKILMEDAINKLDQNSDPNIAINTLVNKSFKISNQNHIQIVDLFSNFEERQQFRKHIKENPKTYKRFRFNIPSIDECLPGGLTQPMIASIAAKTGRGKSVITIYVGWEAAQQKFNVTHITSENENIQTTGRYDSRISEFKYDDIQLYNLPIEERKKFELKYKKLRSKVRNKIMIVKCNPNDFTAATIQHALNILESQGHKTDLLIIDSPDLMQSTLNVKDKRLQQSAIYWEVKCLLEEKKCIGFVTTQLTKLSSDENPLAEDLSESYDKARMLDFLMVLSQNKTQKINNEATLAVVKNRDGKLPKDFTTISTQFDRMKFEEKPREDDPPVAEEKTITTKKKPELQVIDGGKSTTKELQQLRNISKKKNVENLPGIKRVKKVLKKKT